MPRVKKNITFVEDESIHEIREEYKSSLELVAKLNNWKANYSKLDDYNLRTMLLEVINPRIKELNERIIKLEKRLGL